VIAASRQDPMLERGRPELQWRAILAGVAGNVMEWYDFSVYGYFAAVIGRRFFPAEDPIASLLAAFGVFAAGLFMRPFGSLVFGHIGDKMGRKAALTASVALMAVPTFSVGGEIGTSFIFLVEHSAPGNRGFLGSFGPFGVYGGILSGSAVGVAVSMTLDRAAVDVQTGDGSEETLAQKSFPQDRST